MASKEVLNILLKEKKGKMREKSPLQLDVNLSKRSFCFSTREGRLRFHFKSAVSDGRVFRESAFFPQTIKTRSREYH
jgi:hypothetical protein